MHAKFYHCKVDERYVYKLLASDQTNTDQAYIEVLEPTDIIRPRLRISTGRLGQYTNYLWIQELDRFYYIRNITMENGYTVIQCEEDVLMTFRNGLAQKGAMIRRNEIKYNNYLTDPKLQVNAPTRVKIVKDGWKSPFSSDKNIFYLALVSGQGAES